MIGNRFHCRTNTEPKWSVTLFAACFCLAVLVLGQSVVLACLPEDLHAEIEHSIGAPGPWSTGNFSVVVGQTVYFRAVDAWGNVASAVDLDVACGGQQTDTAQYTWDFNYNTGPDDDDPEPDPWTYSTPDVYTVRLDVDDVDEGDCLEHEDPIYDEVTVTVVGPALYVNTNAGDDENDGTGWGDAKATIQGALDVAVAGQEIWVVAGTYEETISLNDGVAVYGGFAGNETSRDQRKPRTNVTTIEGYVGSPTGRGPMTVIDGFTIDGEGNEYWGVIIYNSSPVVSNNVILNQSAFGIRCYGDSSPTITNNLILNSQGVGSGIEVRCSADVVNNTICGFSKGINCVYSGSPNIYNNIVASNDINMYCDGVSTPTLGYNCVYGHTTAPYSGLSAGTGDISDPPGFVGGGDYHLSNGSDCINKGYDSAPSLPSFDFDGEIRSFGDHVDIGADEYVQPSVTIEQAAGQYDPTNTTPISFTVVFSVPVSDFDDADDVSISGTAGGTKNVSITPIDSTHYTVEITDVTPGTVIATVPADVAHNSIGAVNAGSTSTDNSVSFDDVAPTIGTCTVTPVCSTGVVTISYTGAADTGGSGLFAVGLYEVDGGQYSLIDARTGSSNSFTLTCTGGEGTVDNLVLVAWDNAGNPSAVKTVPAFTIDQTSPSQPANVVMSHVLPTSRYIHATWDDSTDANGIQNYSYQFWYTTSSGGPYALSSVLTTTDTYATLDLGGYPSVDPTSSLGVRIWARDNAGNVSDYTDSAGVVCNKVKVGFLYYKCQSGVPYTYSNFRWYIDSYLNNVKYYGACAGNVTYTTISSPPSTTSDYASYDVLIVALPASDFTSTEIGAIQSFVNNQGFNKRLVLAGEYGKTSYNDGYSTCNGRLNTLISTEDMNLTTAFHTTESTQTAYDLGIELDYTDHYRDCTVRSHYLTNGVGALWDAAPSAFANYVHPIAAMRDGENVYPGKFWVVEEDIPQGCSVVCIHDCGLFLFEYDGIIYNTALPPWYMTNLAGNDEVDCDDVPDRNLKFVENLYTVFPH